MPPGWPEQCPAGKYPDISPAISVIPGLRPFLSVPHAGLRNIIEVRKWQVNQAAGRYIRSHEAVQHISIRDRLNDFMQQHGTALAAALAPELMSYSELTAIARNCAIQRATDALREALLSWLAKGEKINYSAQDSDILTTIGFRPDAASVDDSREKFTPAQNMIFSRKSAQLASHQSV